MPWLFIACSMLGVVADREQPAMHLGMQGLDPAVHHLGKAGQFGNIPDRQSGRRDRLRGAAGGDELDAVAGQRAGEFDQAGLSETDNRARVTRRGWSVMGKFLC